jgi:hypothetical protein
MLGVSGCKPIRLASLEPGAMTGNTIMAITKRASRHGLAEMS